ncbi:MAG: hypothetical protein K2Y71_19770 [Xanthobacteraceae bacterium]|nr:hypothetical protein [Xanthobacteraceae bacterium]
MTSARMILPGLMSLAFLASPVEAQLATEMKLDNAGFVMRVAKTPRQMERLRTIPARRIVARTKNGVKHYLYADPEGCQCVMIGNERAMANYRDMVKPPPLPPGVKDFEGAGVPGGVNVEREMIHEMNADGEPPWEDDPFDPVGLNFRFP